MSGKKKVKKPDDAQLFAETIRAMMLDFYRTKKRKKSHLRSEGEVLLEALWTLYNPAEIPKRDTKFESTVEEAVPKEPGMPPIPPRQKFFTAHAHPNEPLEKSPDDILKYHELDIEHGAGIHYIVDGLDGKKVE